MDYVRNRTVPGIPCRDISPRDITIVPGRSLRRFCESDPKLNIQKQILDQRYLAEMIHHDNKERYMPPRKTRSCTIACIEMATEWSIPKKPKSFYVQGCYFAGVAVVLPALGLGLTEEALNP